MGTRSKFGFPKTSICLFCLVSLWLLLATLPCSIPQNFGGGSEFGENDYEKPTYFSQILERKISSIATQMTFTFSNWECFRGVSAFSEER